MELQVTDSERENITIVRKSIVASRNKYTQDNITVKRPGTGTSPMKWYDVLASKTKRDFDEMLIEL